MGSATDLASIDRRLRELDLDSAGGGELLELLTLRGALVHELAQSPITRESLEQLQHSLEAGLDLSQKLNQYRGKLASERRLLAGYGSSL